MRIWEINPMTFGDDLREMRMDMRLTQQEFADRIKNVSKQTIASIEQGKVLPNLAVLLEMAKVFKVDEIRVDTSERWYR